MVDAMIKQPSDSIAIVGERRVTLHDVTWEAYEKILEALGDNRSARLTYDDGMLEIMSPLEEHGSPNRRLESCILILTDELEQDVKTMGSTTLNRPDLKKGSEPDSCYYIQNEPLVRGKTVDLKQDPPPDLILEIDITHSDINKLRLYAAMGTPEFWRYNGKVLRIYQLVEGSYQEVAVSPTFPWVSKEKFYDFLRQCQAIGEMKARKEFRAWVREQIEQARNC